MRAAASSAKDILVVAACAAAGCLLTTSAGAAAPPPRVVAVVPSSAGSRLEPLDARTLAPVPGGWSLRVAASSPVALSPSGSQVAVAVVPSDLGGSDGSIVVVDTRTGRVLTRYRNEDASGGLYWLGTNLYPLLFAVGFDCGSHGCGSEYTAVTAPGGAEIIDAYPRTVLREGLVFASDPTSPYLYNGNDVSIELPRMPPVAPFQVVADVAHDRLFVVSGIGLVAEVDRVGHRPHITYHTVGLSGHRFEAAWIGGGRIALWGQDGLGTIDTRTWTTHPIADGVTGAVATPYGLAAWTNTPGDGLTVYRPDGSTRLHVLTGKSIRSAVAYGSYLYLDADGRYSLDLHTGKVLGPLPSGAAILTPSIVPIP